jgi:hypothetical protein
MLLWHGWPSTRPFALTPAIELGSPQSLETGEDGDERRSLRRLLLPFPCGRIKVKNSALFHLAQPFSKRYTRYNVLIARYIKN